MQRNPSPVDPAKRYLGRPCKFGHDGWRFVSSRSCCACTLEKKWGNGPLYFQMSGARQQKCRDTTKRWLIRHKHEPEAWARRRHSRTKAICKKIGRLYKISWQDIFAAIPLDHKCPVLGISLIFGSGKQSPNNPSIDCIDPRLRYVKGNIRVISHRANQLKSDVTDAEELQKVVDDLRRQY